MTYSPAQKERMFHEAQERAANEAREAAQEWSDKITPEIAAVFAAIDALGDSEKAAGIAEAVYNEFDLFNGLDVYDLHHMSADAKAVWELNDKFFVAFRAQWALKFRSK